MARYLFILVAVLMAVGCKDDKTNEDACPNGTIYNDCSLGGACGDPTTASKCVGDMLLYCGAPTDPCWIGSQKFERDCAASGGHCVTDGPCAAHCEPANDSDAALAEIDDLPDIDEPSDMDKFPDIDEYPDADCMQCATYSFTIKLGGTVTNEGGAPVQGIAVAIYDNEVATEPQAISDVEGKWSIETSLGKCGGVPESSVDAKVIAVDIDDEANGVYVETVTDFSPWNVHNEEWKPPCADYDVYLEELGIQVVMQSEQPDDDVFLPDSL